MNRSAIKIAIITGLLVAAVLYAYITWKKASLLDKSRKAEHIDKADEGDKGDKADEGDKGDKLEKYTSHDEDLMTIKDTKYITQKATHALVSKYIDQY
jgi:hypothetical protein